jgi:hypothetical protein
MRLSFAVSLTLAAAALAKSETMCISVYEEVPPEALADAAALSAAPDEQCYAFEDAVMGAFFDAGHIATNARIMLGTPSLEPYSSLVTEAKDGGAAWLLSFTLGFGESEAKPGIRYIQVVKWKILELSPRSRKMEGILKASNLKGTKPPANLEEARSFASALGSACARDALKAIAW